MNLKHIIRFCNYNVENLNLWLVPTPPFTCRSASSLTDCNFSKSLDANLGLTCSWICFRILFQLQPGLNSCSVRCYIIMKEKKKQQAYLVFLRFSPAD